jgi:hypothetical protein
VCREPRGITGVARAGRRRFVNGNDASILTGGRVVFNPTSTPALQTFQVSLLRLGRQTNYGQASWDKATSRIATVQGRHHNWPVAPLGGVQFNFTSDAQNVSGQGAFGSSGFDERSGVDCPTMESNGGLSSYEPCRPHLLGPKTIVRGHDELRVGKLCYQALTAQLADNRRALLEAQERYRRGKVGLLPVLEDQQLLYATQDAQVASALTRCLADTSLFKALGGNWQEVAL